MKPKVPKTRCSGQWSEAEFITFIKSQLRGATWKWKPTSDVLKAARQIKGWYLCNGCKEIVPATIKVGTKRVKNVFVDHIKPIIDPLLGFTNWTDFINNLFCESENLQVLCKKCHDIKTGEERKLATARRKSQKIE